MKNEAMTDREAAQIREASAEIERARVAADLLLTSLTTLGHHQLARVAASAVVAAEYGAEVLRGILGRAEPQPKPVTVTKKPVTAKKGAKR